MARVIPICPARPQSPKVEELCYQISLLTPMFGGGVHAGKVDQSMPFRPTAIRGQLQFWWRATIGAQFADAKTLLERHSEIWGNTGKASPVKIVVGNIQTEILKPCAEYQRQADGRSRLVWDNSLKTAGIPYALFPFAGKPPIRGQNTPEEYPAEFLSGGSFTLRVACPQALRGDVQTAIRAWVNFGGLGARTRRGCGSIYCKDLAPTTIAEVQRLAEGLLTDPPHDVREWPTLGGSLLIGDENAMIDAWASAAGALQRFRQGPGSARNPGQQGRPGRSRWQEPETVRHLTKKRLPVHQRMENIPQDAFPRAELGLPIMFHFKDQRDGDPDDTTLYPYIGGNKCDRMASPLIIKALGLQNNKAVPIVLRLRTLPLQTVRLDIGGRPYDTGRLRGAPLAQYDKSPMNGTASGSALDAFINFVQDEDVWGILP